MSFVTLVGIVARRWRVVVMGLLVGVLVGAGLSMVVPPGYQGEAQALFGLDGAPAVGGGEELLQQMPTYAALATTSAVLAPVIAEVGYVEGEAVLRRNVTAIAPDGTFVLQVAVSDRDAVRSAVLANAVLSSYSRLVGSLPTGGSGAGGARVTMSVVQPAVTPTEPSSLSAAILVPAAAFAGALAAVLVLMMISAVRPIEPVVARRSEGAGGATSRLAADGPELAARATAARGAADGRPQGG